MSEQENLESPSLALGSIIDSRYQIVQPIGSGATGTVYEAKHVAIGRIVAIKLAKPSLSDMPEISARFEREALAIGLIQHPNCVAVLDAGKLEDGTRFLVMEMLNGLSLADLLEREERVSVERAIHIMRHILRGLCHVHRAKIVHRDIKPENVFLVAKEEDKDFAKILDFGLAKLDTLASDGSASKPLTRAGMTFGTPQYMSPEQVCGKPVDARSDLYAATVVLFEMLTGSPPFQGDDPMTILPMHLTVVPPSISEVVPELDIPKGLEAIISKGLCKQPEERFASAESYLAAIEEIAASDWGAEHTPVPDYFPTESQLEIDARDFAEIRQRSSTARPDSTGTDSTGTDSTGADTKVLKSLESDAPSQTAQVPAVVSNASSKMRGRILAVVGAVAILAVVLGFGFRGKEAPALNIAKEGAVLLEDGNPKAAISFIKAKEHLITDDVEAQLVLGHAYASIKKYENSMVAYGGAIALEPVRGKDEELRKNLSAALASGRVSTRQKALRMLEVFVTSEADETAKDEIVRTASSHPKRPTRLAAREIAEKLGAGNMVDRLQSYSLDLKGPEGCQVRKKAVAQLKALGDKAALPLLKASRQRRRKKKNLNACLVADAKAAIAYLESLP